MPDETPKGWHLDRRIPITLVIALVMQSGGFIWYAAQISGQVDQNARAIMLLQEELSARDKLADRTTRLEALMEGLQSGVRRIEDKLDRLVETRR